MPEPVSVLAALTSLAHARPDTGSETLPLAACLGRVLSEPVTARTTLPPADVSAMDGYAVRLGDVREVGNALTVIGEAPAGQPFSRPVGAMEAVRIFTGGAVPPGADHVLIQEHAERRDNRLLVTAAQDRPRHIRRMGLDFSVGDVVLPKGMSLGPAGLALAAAANYSQLVVRARPKVALIASGNELRPPGSQLRPGEVVNSNATAIAALIRVFGGEPLDGGLAPDSVDAISKCAEEAAETCDLIVAMGGASVGDHDLMRSAFRKAGASIIFEKIAVRPGKPTWHARLGRVPVLGLPGNPATAYVCAHLFLAPLLGAGPEGMRWVQARLNHALPTNGPREAYIRARTTETVDGRTVSQISQQDTALIHPFLDANCLIRRMPADAAGAVGDVVDCLMLVEPTPWTCMAA